MSCWLIPSPAIGNKLLSPCIAEASPKQVLLPAVGRSMTVTYSRSPGPEPVPMPTGGVVRSLATSTTLLLFSLMVSAKSKAPCSYRATVIFRLLQRNWQLHCEHACLMTCLILGAHASGKASGSDERRQSGTHKRMTIANTVRKHSPDPAGSSYSFTALHTAVACSCTCFVPGAEEQEWHFLIAYCARLMGSFCPAQQLLMRQAEWRGRICAHLL